MVVSYQVASMDQSGNPSEFFDEIVGDYYVEVKEGVFLPKGKLCPKILNRMYFFTKSLMIIMVKKKEESNIRYKNKGK